MPTIAYFFGIYIFMHITRKEHLPPHVHARYGEYTAACRIEDGELLNGEIPIAERKMVKEFILNYKERLQNMWDTETYDKLTPLK